MPRNRKSNDRGICWNQYIKKRKMAIEKLFQKKTIQLKSQGERRPAAGHSSKKSRKREKE